MSATHRVFQQGATLLTSIMILLILTVLALSVAQVTGLQERMASLYRADQQAFQAAERGLRNREFQLLANSSDCFSPYDIFFRQRVEADPNGVNLQNLSIPSPTTGQAITAFSGSRQVGRAVTAGGSQCLYFRVTSLQSDDAANPTSSATVQSIFVP